MGVLGAVDLVEETGLAEAELERAELAGEEVDDGRDVWWRDENGVDAVDDTVGAEDVDGHQPGVEVDRGSLQRDAHGQTLLVAEKLLWLVKCGDGVAVEDASGRVEVIADMVE